MPTGINTYLFFKDNAEEAFNFYKSIFGGEFLFVQKYKDAPGQKLLPGEENRIMHISLPVGKSVLMGSDSIEDMHGWNREQGNNFSLSIDAASKAEADKIHGGLSAGGKVTQPMADQFWGA